MPQNIRTGAQEHLTGMFLPTDLPVLVKSMGNIQQKHFQNNSSTSTQDGHLSWAPKPTLSSFQRPP